jgi:hypothetical protein
MPDFDKNSRELSKPLTVNDFSMPLDRGDVRASKRLAIDTSSDTSTPPLDIDGRVYTIFYLLGMGQMLPWNVFINANAYFAARFDGSAFSLNFQNFFSLAFQVCNVIVVILASKFNSMLSPRTRMLVPLVGNSFAFLVTTGMTVYKDIDPEPMFYITIATCVAAGTFMAVLQSGVFGLAAQFPQEYSQAVMGGQVYDFS